MSKVINSAVLLFLAIFMAAVFTGCSNAGDAANPSQESGSAAPSSETSQPKSVSDGNRETVELTISAAASLTDALKEIQQEYEAAHSQIKLNFNFGGSGTLQQQIEQGAPADLFLSASRKNMQALIDQQFIEADHQMNLLKNELVVIVPDTGGILLKNLEGIKGDAIKRIAIGIPESVPAGNYAKKTLENANLWDILQPKAVQAKDVRQVLQYVETGNVEAGFVYKTDAIIATNAEISFVVNQELYTPVEYPMGIVKSTKHSGEADELYIFLQSADAQKIFIKYGFSIPE